MEREEDWDEGTAAHPVLKLPRGKLNWAALIVWVALAVAWIGLATAWFAHR